MSTEQEMPRWFVLQAADPVTGCPMLETRFRVSDVAKLRAIVGSSDAEDPDFRCGYSLEPEQLAEIGRSFGAHFASGDHEVTLVPWHSIREAPYLIHTEFELALMLDGRKPFAKFSGGYPSDGLDEQLSKFAPFVASGRLVRRDVKTPLEKPGRFPDGRRLEGILEVFFALPGEEWRIDANLLLYEVAGQEKWNDTLERYEGSLLGYEDWQNDWWIDELRRRRA
jgi:hypothetical protein